MKSTQAIRGFSAITIAVAFALLALTPADGTAEEVAVMRHTTQPLPGYGTLTLEIWNDGTDVQVIGLDAEGRIMLAREGTMSTEPTFEGTGAIEGMLPAEQLSVDTHGTVEHERCAAASCARGIATAAEAIVRASTMGPAEGVSERTIMAKLCPTTGLDDAHAHAPTEAIAAIAANTPCKWQPVPIEDLAPMPGVGRQTQVRIGATLYQLRQARWAIRPGHAPIGEHAPRRMRAFSRNRHLGYPAPRPPSSGPDGQQWHVAQ